MEEINWSFAATIPSAVLQDTSFRFSITTPPPPPMVQPYAS